jgi:hypothetical protein
MTDDDLLKRLHAVHDGMLNNPAYPSPPVDMRLCHARWGKTATIERSKRRADVIIMLRLLGHYVEAVCNAVCNNDMKTFASSGFAPATTVRTPPQPISSPLIVAVDQGSPGQLVVTIKPVAKARSYEVRYAVVPAAGATVNWNTIVVPSTKPPTSVDHLTPGGTYTFQVRAFGKLGFSHWSASVERMCI